MDYKKGVVFAQLKANTSKIETIKSFNRKINRTREVLKSPKKKFFIYYRHYHWDLNLCTNLNILINESKNFCELYKKLYKKRHVN